MINGISEIGAIVQDRHRERVEGEYGYLTGPVRSISWDNLRSFVGSICGIPIKDFPTFNQRMYTYMYRLMMINVNERNITLDMLGDNAYPEGNSQNFGTPIDRPEYSRDMNYLDYYDKVRTSGVTNENSTRQIIGSGNSDGNILPFTSGFGNDIYHSYENLYPDDLDKGEFNNKWEENLDRNSILYKTKKLFRNHKVNTLISRFATNADDGSNNIFYGGQKRSNFGESHGKNLLTKKAENGGGPTDRNGYQNPYCRVWTHHYQMASLKNAIRPFYTEDENGQNGKVTPLTTIHKWEGFDETATPGGWKNGNPGWEHSVIDKDTGLINITPSYVNGGASNIHPKDCMFSIENLAWKDYDPYSFEQCLSWEQRGPMGGRIMWFPPYNLNFSETTQANWQASQFIGRGEDVFTYTNTIRTGTLTFTMLTDHPSITDYATWYTDYEDNGLKDTDWLRFFAGCDSGDPKNGNENGNGPFSVFSKAKPTPLTDEYNQIIDNDAVEIDEENQEIPLVDPNPEVDTIEFYTFFPNNYSGLFDRDNGIVDPILYLLGGYGCQKNGKDDIPIDWSNFNTDRALGYEMGNEPISYGLDNVNLECKTKLDTSSQCTDKNFIAYNKKQNGYYDPSMPIKWYYRIDGEYTAIDKGRIKNTYDQNLARPSSNNGSTADPNTNVNYWDVSSNHFNLNVDSLKDAIGINNIDNVYSTAEIACAIAKMNGNEKIYNYLIEKLGDTTRVDSLVNIFGSREITSIDILGCAPEDGLNPSGDTKSKRNANLAEERAETIKWWLKDKNIGLGFENGFSLNKETINIDKKDVYNNNGDKNKASRRTHTIISFTKTDIKSATDCSDGDIVEKSDELIESQSNTNARVMDYQYYETLKKDEVKKTNYGFDYQQIGSKVNQPEQNQYNKLRYDQEYHFFKKLQNEDPIIWSRLTDKLRYFDPAFHSMTPEGFNERLTFLHQCTRQGNTLTMSDNNGSTANNLAFGRPPFCILRIGDFYNQMIVIDSININYAVSDGLSWDLNHEGIGVQPMLATISINFKFVGGGDMTGPVRRLQNAMSFNYYANTSLYDNRADRMVYNTNYITMGGAGNDEPDTEKSYAYVGKRYDKNAEANSSLSSSGTSGNKKSATLKTIKPLGHTLGFENIDKYKSKDDVLKAIASKTGLAYKDLENEIDDNYNVDWDKEGALKKYIIDSVSKLTR